MRTLERGVLTIRLNRTESRNALDFATRIPAEDAARLGIVHRLFASDSLAAESLALAQRLADGPSSVIGTTKQLLLKGLTADLALHLDAEREAMWKAGSSPAGLEGIAAFLDKRPPRFRGL